MHLVHISLVVVLSLVLWLGDNSQEEIQLQYCDMIHLYLVSEGKAGWPAYKGTDICTP